MTIIRQVTFDSANRKKDRSVSMRFTTNLEQSTDEFMEMDKLINSSGVVVFSERSKLTDEEWYEKSNEGRDFLALAEPIKVGHHSEKRHRALIQRNWDRMEKSMELLNKSLSYNDRIDYWERKSKEDIHTL